MSYWSEVKEVALKGIDLAISNIKEGTEIAIEKGRDGVAYVQLKKDLFMAQRELHNLLADFGDAAYELYKTGKDISTDSSIKETAVKIAEAETKCRDIEKRIKDITTKG
jgi:hypothetical protein